MKTVRHSLVDYELPLLKAIADCRAILLNSSDHTEIIDQLVEALLSPVSTEITLDDLSQAEREALNFLLSQNGLVEASRFTRQFGDVRSMGPARLEREQPWKNPANPTESLWYRGLIYKAFQVTDRGSQEVVYIPQDLLPLLRPDTPQTTSQESLQITEAATPAKIIRTDNHLRENVFRILVYLQTNTVRLREDGSLAAKDRDLLTDQLLPPLSPTYSRAAELEFLLHLGRRSNLLAVVHGRLKPAPTPAKSWLQAAPAEQVQLLQKSWQNDHTWNDLWRTPSLVPQPTGWENSPLRARSKILEHLENSALSTAAWLSIDQFASKIKQIDPDFQRPNGDYESWYIQDLQGNFLMGFSHWDEVEGALIRYVLSFILPLLGVVDLGYAAGDSNRASSIRLTPQGKQFLTGRSSEEADSPKKPAYLRVTQDFQVRVPLRASLYDRFQLARFAELKSYEDGKATYHIHRGSIRRAMKNGVTPDQITAFLARATNSQTPLKVVEAVRSWGARYESVQLEQATLLHLKHAELAAELHRHPDIGPLLGESLNATTILVPSHHVSQLRRALRELGYLD